MEEKEVKIVPPEGYEIDKENSTFECIKFKKKEKEPLKSIPAGTYFYVGGLSYIIETHNELPIPLKDKSNYNLVSNVKYAKSVLAYCRLSLLIEKDPRYGGPITDEEWQNTKKGKYVIMRYQSEVTTSRVYDTYRLLAFHKEEQRDLFLKENFELIKQYYMIP